MFSSQRWKDGELGQGRNGSSGNLGNMGVLENAGDAGNGDMPRDTSGLRWDQSFLPPTPSLPQSCAPAVVKATHSLAAVRMLVGSWEGGRKRHVF